MSPEVAESAAPLVIDFRDGLGLQKRLFVFFSNGHERLMVRVRTYVAVDQLKDRQRRLKTTLDRYIRRHRKVAECLRYWTRLAFDAEAPYGAGHRDLYVCPRVTTMEFQSALAELDTITSSDDWSSEISQSLENRTRRHK